MPDILEMLKVKRENELIKKADLYSHEQTKYKHCVSCLYQFQDMFNFTPCDHCEAIYDENGEEDLESPTEWIYEDEEGLWK